MVIFIPCFRTCFIEFTLYYFKTANTKAYKIRREIHYSTRPISVRKLYVGLFNLVKSLKTSDSELRGKLYWSNKCHQQQRSKETSPFLDCLLNVA